VCHRHVWGEAMSMSPRLLRPRDTAFTPRSISGLALWLDASASGSLFQDTSAATVATANPNPIGYWKDLSGNGRHPTQGTANNRVIISPAARNSRTALRCDGVDDFLLFPDTSIQSLFIACYAKQPAGKSLDSLIGYRDPLNEQGSGVGIRRASTSLYRGLSSQPGSANSGDFAFPAGSEFRVNGISTSSANDEAWHILTAIRGGSALTMNCIGAHFRVREWGGDIGEVICYDRIFTTSERDTVERALGKKWGLTIG